MKDMNHSEPNKRKNKSVALVEKNQAGKKRKLDSNPEPLNKKPKLNHSATPSQKKKKKKTKATNKNPNVVIRPKALKILQKKKKFGTSQKKTTTPTHKNSEPGQSTKDKPGNAGKYRRKNKCEKKT